MWAGHAGARRAGKALTELLLRQPLRLPAGETGSERLLGTVCEFPAGKAVAGESQPRL